MQIKEHDYSKSFAVEVCVCLVKYGVNKSKLEKLIWNIYFLL